ncbi:proton channel OtopLc-like isoform X2 [Neocloeon triangulifer]|uniref:proton channel OtopLc-like isoform X2 n=1 Tax=Neocloeon triangulifer TaxID=2078957 RepID=UPI00286EDDC0|nr:proton channel OtopLc-like isoform X2 [Neocloeon triangulifer]
MVEERTEDRIYLKKKGRGAEKKWPTREDVIESVYNDHQHSLAEQDSLNASLPRPSAASTTTPKRLATLAERDSTSSSPKVSVAAHSPVRNSLLRILRRKTIESTEMVDRAEPFRQLWVALSSLYGQALVLVMLAICLIEVMDNSVRIFSMQGFLLLYMYVGGIAVILCIYVWVLIDSCGSLSGNSSREYDSEDDVPTTDDAENPHPLTRFGSLKRAHRAATTGTSFYIRVGAILFGLATLVFSGLEVAMHSTMDATGTASCLSDIIFVHPVLHGLFTFLQMHFLFVNSQVVVERFGLAARFGFMHLAATNVALWVRLIVWESGTEWIYSIHQAQQRGRSTTSFLPSPLELKGFPRAEALRTGWTKNASHLAAFSPVSADHISQVVSLHECLNANSLGQLWTSATPFLTPFIVQFCVISAAVTYVMGLKVGQRRHIFKGGSKGSSSSCSGSVDCNSSSRGLFLGLLCVVAGVVVIIVFFVVKGDPNFPQHLPFWLSIGTQGSILALAAALSLVGIAQVRRLASSACEPPRIDRLLSKVSAFGVVSYSIFSLAAGVGRVLEMQRTDAPEDGRAGALIAYCAVQLLHVALQSGMLDEICRRQCSSRGQIIARPGRQIVTCLLCLNGVMWVFDSLVTFSWISQELQLNFYGVLTWGVISRISLPLLVLHRFHSCVRLLNAWQKAYN